MKPAYHIHLTATQKRLIAEIAAIQSQIEWLMQLAVKHDIGCSPEVARTLMGSTSIRTLSDNWLAVMKDGEQDEETLAWFDLAYSEVGQLAQDRNAYLHTLYAHQTGDSPDDYNVDLAHDRVDKVAIPVAIRIRNNKVVDLSGLKAARDRAAKASVLFAHIEWEMMQLDVPSPFRRRLFALYPQGPVLPEAPKASRRERPPRSSAQ